MPPLAHSSTKIIGVLAPSRERFQSIANLLREPCVWLTEPLADDPAPAADTFIIDSDSLPENYYNIVKCYEHYRPSVPSARADRHESAASPASLPRGEGVIYLQESLGQQSIPLLKPGQVVIYQCADHLDADNPLQNT